MLSIKNFLNTIIFIFISSLLYPASEISSKLFFTSAEMKIVLSGEFLTSVILNGKGEVYTPGVENILPVKNYYFTETSSDYDIVAVEKGFFYMEVSKANRLKIYRTLTGFSALKGMSYYSQTQGTISTLILDGYKIKSPEDNVVINTKDRDIPEKIISHFAVKDNRLGSLYFRSEFINNGDNFIVNNTSIGNSTKFGMKIFNSGDYSIHKIFIYDRTLKGYFFYTTQFMKVRSDILNKINLIKPESFGNRIRAENVHFLKSLGIDRTGKLAAFK